MWKTSCRMAVLCCTRLVWSLLKVNQTRQVRLIQNKWQHIVPIFTKTWSTRPPEITGKPSSQIPPLCSEQFHERLIRQNVFNSRTWLTYRSWFKIPVGNFSPLSRGSTGVCVCVCTVCVRECVLFAEDSVSAFSVIIMTEWEGHSLIRNAILLRSHCDFYFQVLESGNQDWSQSRTDYGFFSAAFQQIPPVLEETFWPTVSTSKSAPISQQINTAWC